MPSSVDAFRWKGRSFSYDLLGDYLHSTCRRLKEFGIKEGTLLALAGEPSPSYLIVLLSLWRLNVVPYLLHPRAARSWSLRQTGRGALPFVLVDIKTGLGRRESLLGDMVTLEIVEGFLSHSQQGGWRPSPDFAAAVLVSLDLCEQTVTFRELEADRQGGEAGGETVLALPLYRLDGLAGFYRSFMARGTMVF